MSGYRQVLSHRVAGTLFVSSTASTLGDWVGFAALVVLAYKRSGSVIGPAALFTVQGICAVVSSTIAGPWLDGIDRRTGIMTGYLLGAAAISLPLLVLGRWPLFVAVGLIGAIRPLTAAFRHATAGIDLPPKLLGPTIALEGATGQFVVAIGLALGGAVTVILGYDKALLLDVASFTFAGLHAMRLPRGRGANAVRRSWAVGYQAAFADVASRRLMLLLVASAFVGSLPETLAPIGSEGAWLPVVLAAQAMGTAVGSFALGWGRRFEQPTGLMSLVLTSGVMLLVGATVFDDHPALLGAANLLFGVGFAFTITARTAFTRGLDPSRLGAAVASAITLVMLSEALGSLALAGLAEAIAPWAAYAGAAVVILATGAAAAVMPLRTSAT